MIFTEMKEKVEIPKTNHNSRKEFLYGSTEIKINNIPSNLPYLEPHYTKVGIFIPKKLNNKRTRKVMWGIKEAENFIKTVTEEFSEDSQIREARVFVIASLFYFGIIDFSTVRRLMTDSDDIIYMNSIYNVLAEGYHLFPDFELVEFQKISDMSVVNKTVQILKNKIPESDSRIADTEKKLEKYNGIETYHNDKELPMLVPVSGTAYQSEGSILRNDFYELEKEFGSLLQGYKYVFYNSNVGMPVLRLFDQSGQFIVWESRIDNGDISGLGKAIELPIHAFGKMDTILVNIKRHPDLIKWFFQNPQTNILTESHYNELSKDFFVNRNIYYFVDFGTPTPFARLYPIIEALSEEDFKKLEENLNKVLNLPWNETVRMPRVRFKEFRGVNDFVLVSDNDVHTTYITECHKEILPGLTIKFKDGEVTTDYNGSPLDFSEVANRPSGLFGGLIY